MIYVTGDMHGDLSRFRGRELRRLKKGDTLIICGDFGFVFDGSPREARLLKWIGRRRYNVLFVEGVHDNLDLLEKYPMQEWCGGMARPISGRLRSLCRGHIFLIEGYRILAFGGGDAPAHAEPPSWWEKLLPGPDEFAETRERLAKAGNEVDYIVTHQSSRKLKRLMTPTETDISVLDTFFDEIRDTCKYKVWFFGGYHLDRHIPPAEVALFEQTVRLGGPVELRNSKRPKRRK